MNELSNSFFKVCDCGAKNPHVYFYPVPDFEELRFPIPFASVESGAALVEIYSVSGSISEDKKNELYVYLRETAKLPEKAKEGELLLVEAIKEAEKELVADVKNAFG